MTQPVCTVLSFSPDSLQLVLHVPGVTVTHSEGNYTAVDHGGKDFARSEVSIYNFTHIFLDVVVSVGASYSLAMFANRC